MVRQVFDRLGEGTCRQNYPATRTRRFPLDRIEPRGGTHRARPVRRAATYRSPRRCRDGAPRLQNSGQIFRYAIATGRAQPDSRAISAARWLRRIPGTSPASPILLRWAPCCARWTIRGPSPVKSALKLLPLVFVRPGELRQAEWTEFDLDGRYEHPLPRARNCACRIWCPSRTSRGDPTRAVPVHRHSPPRVSGRTGRKEAARAIWR